MNTLVGLELRRGSDALGDASNLSDCDEALGDVEAALDLEDRVGEGAADCLVGDGRACRLGRLGEVLRCALARLHRHLSQREGSDHCGEAGVGYRDREGNRRFEGRRIRCIEGAQLQGDSVRSVVIGIRALSFNYVLGAGAGVLRDGSP